MTAPSIPGAAAVHCRATAGAQEPPEAPEPVIVERLAPVLVSFPDVAYPAGIDAAAQRVVVEVAIDATGAVAEVRAIEGVEPFVGLVVEAARAARFEPARYGAEPVPTVVEMPWEFPEPPVNVAGTVRRRGDRAPVADAAVAVGDRVVRTDAAGAFVFRNVAPGEYEVRLPDPALRLADTTFDLAAGERVDLDLFVVEEAWTQEAVGVYQRAPEAGVRRTLAQDDVMALPGSLGDPVRALQNVPGVARTPLDTGWLLVRGGNPEDTGLFLDGVRVPLLYHLGGFTSILHPEMIDGITFWAGAPPARLGRALSGAAAISSRPAEPDWHLVGGLNTVWAHAFVEGPVWGDTAFAASVRRSYLDGILALVLDEGSRIAPRFWDVSARLDGPDAGLLLVGLSDQADAPNGDGTVAVVSQRALQAQGRMEVEYDWGEFALRPYVAVQTQHIDAPARLENIQDVFPGLRAEITAFPGGPVRIVGGAEAEHHTWSIERDGDDRKAVFGWVDPYAEATVGDKVRGRVGMRLDTLFVSGQLPRFGPSPRADVKWQVSDGWALVAEVGQYHQRPLATYLVGFPEGPYLKLERSTGAAGGVRWAQGPFQASADGFYRWIDHLATPEADGSMGSLQGRAYGVETSVGGDWERWHARAIVEWTRTEQREEPGDLFRPTTYDQPFHVVVLGIHELPKGWSLAGRWRFASGFPVAEGTVAYDLLVQEEVVVERDAAGRAAPYHALDLKVAKRWTFRTWRLDAYLDVQNVYNRRVPEPAINGLDETILAYGVGFPVLPIFGLEAAWWP